MRLAEGSLTTQSESESIGRFGVGGVMAGVGIDGATGAGGMGDGVLLHTVLGST